MVNKKIQEKKIYLYRMPPQFHHLVDRGCTPSLTSHLNADKNVLTSDRTVSV